MSSLFEQLTALYRRHRVLCHIGLWAAILIAGAAERYWMFNPDHLSQVTMLALETLSQLDKVLTTYFVVYLLLPRIMERRQYVAYFLVFILGSYLIFMLDKVVQFGGLTALGFQVGTLADLPRQWFDFRQFYTRHLFENLGIAASFLLLKLIINYYELQKKSLMLEKQKTEIELKLLKTQLNPHFLFNTLNNIYSLSVLQNPATSEAIARLSDMLDYVLYRCNGATVLLSDEIRMLENYMALEQLRYDDRLKVHMTTHIVHDQPIAPLLLPSLLENAFKHGAGEDAQNPFIEVCISSQDGVLHCTITNSVAGTMDGQPREKIGLQNLQKQLELLYPHRHQLNIRRTDGQFRVELMIAATQVLRSAQLPQPTPAL